jgi:hypothetical protein
MKVAKLSARPWTTAADYLAVLSSARAKRYARPDSLPTRYFFHLRDSEGLVPDEDGMVLRGMDEVRREAIRGARWIAAAAAESPGQHCANGRIEVQDEAGNIVYELPLD